MASGQNRYTQPCWVSFDLKTECWHGNRESASLGGQTPVQCLLHRALGRQGACPCLLYNDHSFSPLSPCLMKGQELLPPPSCHCVRIEALTRSLTRRRHVRCSMSGFHQVVIHSPSISYLSAVRGTETLVTQILHKSPLQCLEIRDGHRSIQKSESSNTSHSTCCEYSRGRNKPQTDLGGMACLCIEGKWSTAKAAVLTTAPVCCTT